MKLLFIVTESVSLQIPCPSIMYDCLSFDEDAQPRTETGTETLVQGDVLGVFVVNTTFLKIPLICVLWCCILEEFTINQLH